MPIREINQRDLVEPTEAPLFEMIVEEMRSEVHDLRRPMVLIADERAGGAKHLYVVWDEPEWAGLDRLRRSEMALDAYEEFAGLDAALKVTQSWGLTTEEAADYGIRLPDADAA